MSVEQTTPTVRVVKTGIIDSRDSAFPKAIQLPDGNILCSFSVGGGAEVTGHTEWARSTDCGENWTNQGTLLPRDEEREMANFLKLSLAPDGKTIYAYGSEIDADNSRKFGNREMNAILCQSNDGGQTWTAPRRVDLGSECDFEVSFSALALSSGRLLAPGATLADEMKLGERVVVAISDDQGETWPRHSTVFYDPAGEKVFFEHKFSELPGGDILATAWTATPGDYRDLENHYAVSQDQGLTWSPARSTGIRGQTLSTVSLGQNRLLVLYNRRYGKQAIVMCLVAFDDEGWTVHYEDVMYDAHASHERAKSVETGIEEFDTFAFGFPTAIALQDGSILATHWCQERGSCGIRWTRLAVNW
ncbi:MAG: exo-alpha-sialidase [Planctomycetales bacterium]|nr:exo-alpha-sialidase [Planctomycetales bacterium]